MRVHIGLVMVAGLLVGVYGPTRGAEKKGATALEGTWVVISITEGGKEDAGFKNVELAFKGNTIANKSKRGDRKLTFKIDPKKKTIDLVRVGGPGKEQPAKGIYRLKGDVLTVCHSRPGEDRPKDFTAEKGSGNALIVLKSDKSK
jgi:uncharacterized protein (TIGR03067 family)